MLGTECEVSARAVLLPAEPSLHPLEEILISVVLNKTDVSLFNHTGILAVVSQESAKQERQRREYFTNIVLSVNCHLSLKLLFHSHLIPRITSHRRVVFLVREVKGVLAFYVEYLR